MTGALARERLMVSRDPATPVLLAGYVAVLAGSALWILLRAGSSTGAALRVELLWTLLLALNAFALPWAVSRTMGPAAVAAIVHTSVATSVPATRLVLLRAAAAIVLALQLLLAALPVMALGYGMDGSASVAAVAAGYLLLVAFSAIVALAAVHWHLVVPGLPAFLGSLATAGLVALLFDTAIRERGWPGLALAGLLVTVAALALRRRARRNLDCLPL